MTSGAGAPQTRSAVYCKLPPSDDIAAEGDAAAIRFDADLPVRFFAFCRVKINEARPKR